MNQTGSTVQSLDRVFDIVETLSNHGNRLSISQLCCIHRVKQKHRTPYACLIADQRLYGYRRQVARTV